MAEDSDLNSFIRNTLDSIQRVRESGLNTPPQTIISKESYSDIADIGSRFDPSSGNAASGLFGGGGGGQFPFKISVRNGSAPAYKVSYNSSIIDGINGGPFNISGLNVFNSISQQKFIIAEAEVQSNPFKVSDYGFTIKAVDANETDEVVLSSTSIPVQTKLRLLIGKITVENTEGNTTLKPWQAVTTSFRTAIAFHNGAAVYTLQAAPTHQSRI